MRILVNGALGRMGKEVISVLQQNGVDYVGADLNAQEGDGLYPSVSACTEPVDVIVDFSSHLGTKELVEFALSRSLPVVIATTGQTEEEMALIRACAEHVPVLKSGNLCMGIALLMHLAREAARFLPQADIEIVETHHNQKADAPSGTALLLADAIREARPELKNNLGRSGHGKREKDEIGIQAVRLGSVVGRHEIYFGAPGQQITLSHEAFDRAHFAEGALTAARFVCKSKPGLYSMDDMLK
ncbi:MAG: 4-hydroxy-tetrahydrodipicolinate reductase [Eubacteriales bacterium]|nr:4-hydroxy-tetrahydrodipicolinate reductase [Eubacteriales bacterium]